MTWLWIALGVLLWLALIALAVGLCVAAGRADREMEREKRGRLDDDIRVAPGRRFARRRSGDRVMR